MLLYGSQAYNILLLFENKEAGYRNILESNCSVTSLFRHLDVMESNNIVIKTLQTQ